MKKYPKYKDSQIEWIGEVPEHWEITKLRRFVSSHKQGFYSTENYINEGVKLLRITDIDDNSNINSDNCPYVEVKESDKESFSLKPNDFIFARSGTIGRFGIVRQLEDVIFASYLIRFRFKNSIHIDFLKYFFFSQFFKDSIISELHGGANSNIHAENIKEQFLFVPTNEEQKKIANYLDSIVPKIDQVIINKQTQIKLLKEERQAVINQAVTKGIDPNVKMKSSGIEWLGDVPEHWEINKLKYIAFVNKYSLGENTPMDYSFKYIDISNVNENELRREPETIEFKDAPSRARRIVQTGDSIISTVRTYLRALYFFDKITVNTIVSTGFAVVSPFSLFEPKYIFYLISSDIFINKVVSVSVGVSYPAINSESLANIPIWFTLRKEEQKEIVLYILNEHNRIDKIINKIDREIILLQEYRNAIISEAVTGKMDVREVDK